MNLSFIHQYEYYEDTSNDENTTKLLLDDSNYTKNETNSSTFRKGSITGKVQAISFSWLDFLLFFWIITLIMDEIQQVKF